MIRLAAVLLILLVAQAAAAAAPKAKPDTTRWKSTPLDTSAAKPPPVPPAGYDSAAALARARALRTAVSAGDAGALWREFDPGMRGAMKDSATFAAEMKRIHGVTGTLDSVLSEEVRVAPGRTYVLTRARFALSPEPMVVTMAFSADGKLSGLSVRPEGGAKKEWPSPNLQYQTKTKLELPFRSEWVVYWGGRTLEQNRHAVSRSQRFACDFAIARDGSTHRGEGKELTDYYCYGQPILAPAAGNVAAVVDGLPDQAIGASDPAHLAGNHVVIAHPGGEFSVLAHLKPGSIRVKVGGPVRAGDEIGLCGNSGNTTEPHLHYHLANGPPEPEPDGLPAAFVNYVANDSTVGRGEPLRGQRVRRKDTP